VEKHVASIKRCEMVLDIPLVTMFMEGEMFDRMPMKIKQVFLH
jgi:hypothetical protein